MAICKNCGCFTKNEMDVCPKCGYSAKKAADSAEEKAKKPEPPAEPEQQKTPERTVPDVQPAAAEKAAVQNRHAQPQKSSRKGRYAQPDKSARKGKHAQPDKSARKGKHAQPEKSAGDKPAVAETKAPKKKKSKAPLVILLSLLVIILIIAGLAFFFTRNGDDKDAAAFDLTCAEFTAAMNLNSSATPDEATGVKLDVDKWTLNQAHTALEYVGGGFTMKAKTVKNGDVNSKMKELRVGPTDTETGVNMVAQSIVTLEKSLERDAAMRAMSDVKSKVKDKISYETVAFTYDRDKDEFVMVPSKGAKSVANLNATSDEPAFPAVTETPVSGSGIIRTGGQYIIADGEAIRCRRLITDDNKVIFADKNDGQLLSNGEIIFYVKEDKNKNHVCSVKSDGTQNQALFALNEKVRLIHMYNDCLYYAKENADTPGNYDFFRYSLVTTETNQYKDVSFAPEKFVVCGDIMYCSKAPDVSGGDRKNSVWKFDFATEKYTEAIDNCTVSPHGYFNGSGNPCFDSYEISGEDETLSNHFLYTSVDGELKKSPEINVNATLILASPTTDKAVLGNSATGEYYVFDRKTGDCKPLSLPEAEDGYYTFTFDLAKPENMYVTYQQGSGDLRAIKKLWLISGGELVPCTVDDSINCEVDCVITDGYVLNAYYDSYPIKADSQSGTVPQTTSSSEHEKYLGVWSDKAQGNVEHSVKISSVSGDHVTFSVTSNYIMISLEETAENIEADMNNGKADFSYTDKAGNTGAGTIALNEGSVHVRISTNGEGDGVGISFDSDLTEHTPLS